MMRPLALDLCCGKGGWTNGLVKAGWDVIGFDVKDWGYTEATGQRLVLGDIRQAHVQKQSGGWVVAWEPGSATESWIDFALDRKISLVCASPPCQEFSYRSFPFKRCRELAKNVPPDKSIWEACVRIAKEAGAPLILENVRGAQPYMGKAQAHYGSFYLWGDVPALLPIGRPVKGFVGGKNRTEAFNVSRTGAGKKRMVGSEKYREGFPGEYARKKSIKVLFGEMSHSSHSSHSSARAEWSAIAAMIPTELGELIAKCFHPDGL